MILLFTSFIYKKNVLGENSDFCFGVRFPGDLCFGNSSGSSKGNGFGGGGKYVGKNAEGFGGKKAPGII